MKHWGQSVIIDLYKCDPYIIRNSQKIINYVEKLCNLLELKKFGETKVVDFGEGRVKGYSMIQLITTSLISGHFANESNNAYIDIFSCKQFQKEKASEFSKIYFKAKEINVKETYRK